ncbi:hypothetical protein [Streptomyces pratensis]|uniref:hypothetical protein n=1 Tax=Streptomyces pratensis TaxID=1169025 RepID=UPI003015ECA4
MTQPRTDAQALPDRPTLFWGVSFASLGVFLVTWGLLWVKANALNDDLPNACYDLRRQSFPPEAACASMDGTLTGANPGWLEVLFFASLAVGVMTTAMALFISTVVRQR